MLGWMRKQTRSWFVYIAFAIIIIVFVFFYGWRGDMTGDEATVAVVNGERLSRKQFDQAFENRLQLARNLSPNMPLAEEEVKRLRQRALDDIIERALMFQEATRLGISVSQDEIRKQIAGNPAFQRGGLFDKDLYLRQLAANRMSPADYEKAMLAGNLISKLVDDIQNSAKISEAELYELYRFSSDKANLAFIRIDAARYDETMVATPEEIARTYEKIKEDFRVPETVRVRHVVFNPTDYGAEVRITPQEVEQFYHANKDRFTDERKIKARHILIAVNEAGGAQAEEAARIKIDEVRKQLEEGQDFAQLAKRVSQDAATAPAGGDLGYLTRGLMVPGFDEVAFSLKPGELSAPVRTEKGFHLIKVEEIQEASTKSLEAVRPLIEEELRRDKSSEAAKQAARRTVTACYRGGNLVTYAQENGLVLKEIGPFSPRDPIPGIGINKECSDAVFSLREGEITPPLSAEGAYHVFQLIERKNSYLPSLEEVKEKVESRVRREKAVEAAKAKADALLQELVSGTATMEDLARREQLVVEETGFFSRSAGFIGKIGLQEELSRDAFALRAEKPYGPKAYAVGEAFVLVRLKEKEEASREAFEAEKEKQREAFMPLKQSERIRIWLDGLKKRATMEVRMTL